MMDVNRKGFEKQQRDSLADRIVKRTIYIASKGAITYAMMTPDMIIEKRACILAHRQRAEEIRAEREENLLHPKEMTRVCIICSNVFDVKGASLICSNECRKVDGRNKYYADHDHNLELAKVRYIQVERNRRIGKHVDKPIICGYCGELFTPQYNDGRRLYCSATCQKRSERLSGGAYRRYKAERDGERFKVIDIYERDRWICGICNGKVDKRLKYPHPMSASEDHIIAIALGGTHTRENVQLAHLSCNVAAGIGGIKQLRMFG